MNIKGLSIPQRMLKCKNCGHTIIMLPNGFAHFKRHATKGSVPNTESIYCGYKDKKNKYGICFCDKAEPIVETAHWYDSDLSDVMKNGKPIKVKFPKPKKQRK